MNELITVFSAEVMRRLRSRSFVFGLVIGAFGILVMIRLPYYLDALTSSYKVVLAGDPAIVTPARPLLSKDFRIAKIEPGVVHPSERDLGESAASAVIVLVQRGERLNITVYAKDPATVNRDDLRRDLLPLHIALATKLSTQRISSLVALPVHVLPLASKFGSAAQADQARGIAYLLLIVLYLLIVLNSQLLMTSVAEEKTSRIAELLVSAVNPETLLAAKIGSAAVLAIVQMAVWALVGFAAGSGVNMSGGTHEGGAMLSFNSVPASDIVGFVVFFLLGYLQTAVLFAAVGSLINRTEDIGSIGGPFFLPVVAAFIIAITALQVPDSGVVVVTSFIPLIAPFVMFARIVVSAVPLWQIALSFGINVLAIWAIAVIGGRVYRVGMLLYGRTPKFSQLLRTLRA